MRQVGVVGSGFSGTVLVAHLLADPSFVGSVHLWERARHRGRGIAYGTPCQAHVLNVAAHGMSAFPAQPGHFLDWLQKERPGLERAELRDAYAPRADYARYLAASTERVFADALAAGRLHVHHGEVVDVEAGEGGTLRVRAGEAVAIDVDRLALCVGHFAPRALTADGTQHLTATNFIGNPWDYGALAAIPAGATVATLGAGLTMVDVALQLHAQGFAGKLVAVSRHGLLPRSHVTRPTPITLPSPQVEATTARKLVRWLREHIAQHAQHGGDWRQVLDALRPHTVPLWRSLAHAEQARLLRHAKSLWDVHRHRVAPEVGQLLAKLRHEGVLSHHAGRLARIEAGKGGAGLRLHWRLRHHAEPWRQDVDVLVNCTGAHNVWARATEALPAALLARGRVRPGPHGAGIDVAPDGGVLNADGEADGQLFAMGPARLGVDFESVAVPELRVQAEALAHRLAPP